MVPDTSPESSQTANQVSGLQRFESSWGGLARDNEPFVNQAGENIVPSTLDHAMTSWGERAFQQNRFSEDPPDCCTCCARTIFLLYGTSVMCLIAAWVLFSMTHQSAENHNEGSWLIRPSDDAKFFFYNVLPWLVFGPWLFLAALTLICGAGALVVTKCRGESDD